jgi:DHA1 family tetracycline resistance protein-like MFS transporter
MLSPKSGINASLLVIFFTVLIDCIGLRIIYPVAVTLITEVSGVGFNQAIRYSGWLMMVFAVGQFVFSPLVGALSDSYGRRPVLLISLIGLSINYYILSVADTLCLVFIGRLLSGICSASITTGFAYVSDMSDTHNRTRNFGIIGAAISLGFIIGPLIGGILSEWGPRVPFAGAAVLAAANFLYGYFMLPESLQPQYRNSFNARKINPFDFFLKLSQFRPIWKFLMVLFLFSFATQVLPSVWPFYTKYVYHWTDLQIGYSLAFVGLAMALVKSFLPGRIQLIFGPKKTILAGLVFTAIGLALFSFAGTEAWLYLVILLYSIGGITMPSLQGFISGWTDSREQGQLQGIIVSLISLAGMFSPLVMTYLFWEFTSLGSEHNVFFAGAPFLVAAAIILLTLFFLPVRSYPKTES